MISSLSFSTMYELRIAASERFPLEETGAHFPPAFSSSVFNVRSPFFPLLQRTSFFSSASASSSEDACASVKSAAKTQHTRESIYPKAFIRLCVVVVIHVLPLLSLRRSSLLRLLSPLPLHS